MPILGLGPLATVSVKLEESRRPSFEALRAPQVRHVLAEHVPVPLVPPRVVPATDTGIKIHDGDYAALGDFQNGLEIYLQDNGLNDRGHSPADAVEVKGTGDNGQGFLLWPWAYK